MITRWPHVLVEEGPPIAGIERGDTIAFAPENRVFIDAVYVAGSRLALSVSSAAAGLRFGAAWRLRADPARIEHRDASHGEEWRASDGVVQATPWRLRLMLDGPPLATVKRFGPHVAVHPTWLDGAYGGVARSQWVLANARESLVVEETIEGAVSFRTEPRRTGVRVHDLALLADGALDRETAAGIVGQMRDRQPTTWIGFDGVPRAIEASRSADREERVVDVYGLLTRGRLPRDVAERVELAAEIVSTRKASAEEIGAVVRTLGADAWARERALVEECGVLAG